VYCKLSEANLPNTLLQSINRKTLRAGIVDQKGRRGAKAIGPDFNHGVVITTRDN